MVAAHDSNLTEVEVTSLGTAQDATQPRVRRCRTLIVDQGAAEPESPVVLILRAQPKGVVYRKVDFIEPSKKGGAGLKAVLYHERLIHGSTPLTRVPTACTRSCASGSAT